jgi:hypothetical protein
MVGSHRGAGGLPFTAGAVHMFTPAAACLSHLSLSLSVSLSVSLSLSLSLSQRSHYISLTIYL